MQHTEVDTPRSNGFPILVGHHARKLVQVREVMNGPGCQKLREVYNAEFWMSSATGQIFWL